MADANTATARLRVSLARAVSRDGTGLSPAGLQASRIELRAHLGRPTLRAAAQEVICFATFLAKEGLRGAAHDLVGLLREIRWPLEAAGMGLAAKMDSEQPQRQARRLIGSTPQVHNTQPDVESVSLLNLRSEAAAR